MQKPNHAIEQTRFSLPTINNRNIFSEAQFKLSILSIKTRHKDSFYIKAFRAGDKVMRFKRLIIFLTKQLFWADSTYITYNHLQDSKIIQYCRWFISLQGNKIWHDKTLSQIFDRLANFRSSHPEVFLGKGFLKICSKSTGEHQCRSANSIKLQRTLWQGFSPVNLLLIFRTPFSMNTSEWLLLWLENDFELSRILLIYIFQRRYKPSIKKIAALKNPPQPKDKKSMREFLRDDELLEKIYSRSQYYYLHDTLATKHNVNFQWTERAVIKSLKG